MLAGRTRTPDRQEVGLRAILKDGMHTGLEAQPVSRSVNSVKSNLSELIGWS